MSNILILGASYGSLLGTKLAMAGHDVALTCRAKTAGIINAEGTHVRITLRGEDTPRTISSRTLPGKVTAVTPDSVDPADYDLIALAMSEPQYSDPTVKALMVRIAASGRPCLSIMNMPPLPYLRRLPGLEDVDLSGCFSDVSVWDGFAPGLISLCSPDPQAFRPPEEGPNVLQVGLPTNFKAAKFADPAHNALLNQLADDIAAVRLDGKDVPVKLRVFDSLFVPLAKWSMLMTGNYRCVLADGVQPIRDAVHGDIDASRAIYEFVDGLARGLGADAADQVPFEKYANAAQGLLKPSSAARAIDAGTAQIERVDKVVQAIARARGLSNAEVDAIVATVDARLAQNAKQVAA